MTTRRPPVARWTIPSGAAGGADGGKFTLTSTGVLAFASAKDFENPDDADMNGIYAVTVQVSDGALTDTADLTVTLTNANDAPTAIASTDRTRVLPGAVVTLSGSGSDPDVGDTLSLSYLWTQTGSQEGTLTNANAATATYTAPATVTEDTTLTFTLRVTDANGLFHEDTVTVTVTETVAPPLTAQFENAPALHDGSTEFVVHLRFSENVRLNSGAFDGELLTITGGRVTGKGRLMSGSSVGWRIDVTPAGDADVIITLPANRACDPNAAPCAFDGRRLSAPASVTVEGPNLSPQVTGSKSLAAAENQTAVATLTATNDDPPSASRRWTIPSGAAGGADGGKFTLTSTGVLAFASAKDFENPDDADMNGIYAVTVQVRDSASLRSTADLTVTLTNVNEAPTADAGADRTGIAPGTAVTLSGSGSDPDAGDTLTLRYAWTQTGGAMGSLRNANAATATFTVPAGLTETTTFTFRLRVTDAGGLFHEDTVNVMVSGPVITSATSLTAAENQTTVATLTATDADTPDANLTWSIPSRAAGGADGGRFTLSSTGVLAFASAKDFENPDDADTNRSYEVTVEVSNGALKATADLTVTLTDVNETPAADAGPNVSSVQPGTDATLTGSGYDPEDAGNVDFLWTQTAGVTVSPTGADTNQMTFRVPRGSPGLSTFTFKLRVTDSTGLYSEDTAKVTVAPVTPGQQQPQPPMITSAASLTVAENQTAVATLTATDADTPLADLAWSIPAGFAGGTDGSKFTLSTAGDLAFASTKDFENPDNADGDGSYEVIVEVSDGDHAPTLALTVTLTNVNEAPTADAGPNRFAVRPGQAVTLTGSGSDPDTGGNLSYAWTQTGSQVGTLRNANAATATFTAPAAVTQATTLTFTLRVTDAGGLYGEDTVTVTVVPQPPVITGGTSFTAAENQTAVATLMATDADTPDANLTWSIPADAAGGADRGKFTLTSAGVLAFASAKDFENPDDADTNGIYAVAVAVSDGARTDTANLTVTVTNVNEAPTADAGADQTGIARGAVVTLSGSGSDPDAGDTLSLSYLWTQTGSQVGTLRNANTATATFTAPSDLSQIGTLTFRLKVTDRGGLYGEDTVTLTVSSQPPVITSATSLTVAENQTTVAAMTATDAETPDADLIWSIPSGAAGGADRNKFTLSSAGVLAFASAKDFENPDDTDTNGSYAVTVEVSDGALTDTADLTVTLTNVNETPIANAGADRTGLLAGAVVTLSGSGSDPDAGHTLSLSYLWTQTGSQEGTLTNANAATATYTAPPAVTAATTFTFTLRVTDAGGLYDEDTVTVTVNPLLTAQFENAPVNHDRFNSFSMDLRFSEDVVLNSSAFSNGLLTITNGTLRGQRQLTQGSNIAWRIDVQPPADREDMIITLPANRACDPDAAPCTSDGRRLSAAASVTVPSWLPPVLTSATTLTAAENQTAVATLTATDDETPAADLEWFLIPVGAFGAADQGDFTLSADGVLAFVYPQDFEYPEDANTDGRYEVIVQIRDGDLQLSTPTLTVILTNVNEEPTADAGADQNNVVQGAAVTLSGSGSDPDEGDTMSLSYLWTQTGSQEGTLTNANAATATYIAPAAVTQATTLTFTLRVTDAGGLFHEDTVTVTVKPQPPVIASETSFEVAENQTAVATLMATDADTPIADLTWSIPADAAGGADRDKFTLSTDGVLAFASAKDFENLDDADTDGIYAVTVEVSDGDLTDTADLTVTLTNVNEAPIADAGADQTDAVPGATVTLSGSGSDPDAGDTPTLIYAWTQTGEPMVELTDANAATATFNAPDDLSETGPLTFTLRVTDAGGLFHEDTVTVRAAGTLALNLDTIAVDDTVNIAEKTAGFTISGDTGSEAGVSITVTVGTGSLSATSADDNGTATWSVSVPADASYISGASVDVAVNATKTGFTAPAAITRTLTVDLTAPMAPTYTVPLSLKVGVAIAAMSPSGGIGIDAYSATGLPPGLSIDAGTGAISGTPDTADANSTDATVTVSDAAGNSRTVDITFPPVAKGDQTLTGFGYSAPSVAFGSAAPTVTAPSVTAPAGLQTTLSYSAAPSTVCSVDSTTGALTLAGLGSCVITATSAGTDNYDEGTASFTVTVQTAGELVLNLDAVATDNTINIDEKAAGFTISGDTGTESGADVTVQIGTETLTAASADNAGTATWSVSVPVDAPYITGTSVDVTVSATKTGFTAPDNVERTLAVDLTAPTAPTYTPPASLKVGVAIAAMNPSGGTGIDEGTATGLPTGLSIDTGTGAISGTPDTANSNTADATVTVSDAAGNSRTVDITFPPVAKGDQTLTGFQYSASSVTLLDTAPSVTAPSVTVPAGLQTTLSYSATPSTVCSVDSTTGALTLAGLGSCVITATSAGTDNYDEGTAMFTVTVQAAGELVLNLDAVATDNTINIDEKAAGFTISGDTGTEGSVDVTVQIGTETLTATSADNAGTATWSVSVPADASYITGTSLAVEVNATKTGFTAPGAITRTLTVDLSAPTAPTYTMPLSLKVGVAIAAMSPSGGSGIDAYSVTGLPPGLSIDTGTGAISGTPDRANANAADATVTVSDTAGNTAEVSITFPAVARGDQTLTGFQYSASSVTFGSGAPTVTAPSVTAPTGVQTTLSYSATPSTVCSVDSTTGALTLAGLGSCVITATAASTANYDETTAMFTVTVQAAGALVLNLDTIAVDDTVNFDEKAAGFTISGDTDTEAGVSITVTVGTGSLSVTSAADNGTATWSVSVPADASYITGTSVDVTVSASKTGFTAPDNVERTLTVDLTAPTAPTYTAPDSLKVGVAIASMSPTDGSGIDEYSATGLPPGLSIDTGTGAISGTPDTADANSADATVTVSDAAGNAGTVDITFPPVAKGDQTLTGFQYSASSVTLLDTAPSVTAPTGVQTTLSYSATPSAVCSVDSTTGALTLAGAGDCVITATAASTDDYNEASAMFTVAAQAAGELTLSLDTIATDDTVNIDEKDAGFTISGDTGSEAGVSVTVAIGTGNLNATSADDNSMATWSVSVPADASYITGTSVDVTVSATKTGFTAPGDVQRTLTVDLTAPTVPTYTAPDSLKVGVAIAATSPSGGIGIDEYKATGLPTGLSIAAATGVIDGTPDTADANTADATVTVSDAAGNTAEVSITFPAVSKGDQTLTGFQYSASSVTFGSTAPTVTAPGGVETTLSYAATPSTVCTVNSSSGALTLAGVGSCVITATAEGTDDYNETTAMFTVTVQSAGALVLTLDTIATDDRVNIAEKTAGFTISGDTGSEAGVSITVTVGSTELTATSADDNGTATWSVSVPADASYITGTSVNVTVSATKTGFTAPDNVTRTLTVDLTAPMAPTYTAPDSLKVGVAIAATSPSGGIGIDEYSATGLPSGLGIDAGTGVIDGTPVTADANTADATVTVSDAAGNSRTVDITFPAVAKGEQTLTGFQYSASSVAFGSTAPTVTAPGGVETTLSYSATPSTVCTVNDSSGALTLAGVGDCVITATAVGTDDYNEATAMFTVAVQATGALVLNLDAVATDNTINIDEKAAGFSIGGDTGSEAGVSVTVTVGTGSLSATSADDNGTATWSVSVPADASYITGASLVVEVNATKTGFTAPAALTRTLTVDLTAPTAPTYTAPDSLQVGVAIAAMSPVDGIGIDGYSATGLPTGLSIAAGTGVIDGTPDTADANTADATVTVSDAAGNSRTVDITFPAVAKGDQTLTGFQYSASSVAFGAAAPTVTAPGGVVTTLSYSATPSTVCTVNASSGALTLAGVGDCVITATAAGTDDYNEATAMFTVAVQAAGALVLNLDTIAVDDTVNIAEKTAGFTISGDTASEAGVSITVTVGSTELTATSAAADPATWSVSVPADASYITGTSVDVTVSATKTGFTAPGNAQRTLTVDLTAPTAPTYTAPDSLQVGVAIAAMSPTDGIGIDEYSATGLPPGLSIHTGTGAISGTPDTADANTADATVTVSDTAGNSRTVDIAFPAVAKGDQTLTGFQYSASSVAFGSTAPTVTAPGGVETTLSYSATPSAACTVNSSSGALTLAGVGDCVITATAAGNNDYNEATAMFTVAVQAAGALVLNLDAVATDNTINIDEKAAGFSIGGDTGSETGVSVTVTVGTGSLSATSADDNGTATWSVSVPADASYITGTSVDVTVSATKTGFTAPGDVQRTLTVDLTAPTAPTYTAPASLKVDVAIAAMSPADGIGIDAYSATGLPPGLSIDTGTGVISGTPDTADANTADATVTVNDTAGNTLEVSITFPAVARGDQTLTGFQYSASSVTFGSAAPTVTAPGGVVTTLSYSATPSTVCTVNSSSGALTLAGVGSCVITATAAGTDDYDEATAMFTVTVQAAGALVLNLDAIAT